MMTRYLVSDRYNMESIRWGTYLAEVIHIANFDLTSSRTKPANHITCVRDIRTIACRVDIYMTSYQPSLYGHRVHEQTTSHCLRSGQSTALEGAAVTKTSYCSLIISFLTCAHEIRGRQLQCLHKIRRYQVCTSTSLSLDGSEYW